MDAAKFIEETQRMCDTYDTCEGCPAGARGNFVDCRVDIMQAIDAADAVAIVEKWAKEHPRKTRQSEFLKHYPQSRLDESGVLLLCPRYISAAHRNGDGLCKEPRIKCVDCRREFWMQEVE